MNNLLYYPYINVPKTDWLIRALLYYDNIASIVPYQYFVEPERFEPFMREVIQNDLIELVDPMDVINNSQEVNELFLTYLHKKHNKKARRNRFYAKSRNSQNFPAKTLSQEKVLRIHAGKFDYSIFEELTQMGLAERFNNDWFHVEEKTASELMSFLASIIGNIKGYIPATDKIDKICFPNSHINNPDFELMSRQYKRDLILKNLMPYPHQVELKNLRHFKDKYHDLLKAFTAKVELVALNPTISPESTLFQQTLEDMKNSQKELTARMNESKLGEIIFGTIGSVIFTFLDGPNIGTAFSLMSTIYSVCKNQRPESVVDQTGMKYLALIDKRLRKKNS